MALSMAYGVFAAFLVALPFSDSVQLPERESYYVALGYLVLLGSVVAFACYLTLLDRVGSIRSGYVGVMVPVLALIVSALFENYHISVYAYVGAALALVGGVAMNRARAVG